MKAIKGDFAGFTFGDYHTSDLGIIRVSDKDRYNENLLPEIKDGVVDAVGADGAYFFNSFYGKRTFDIDIAYDNLTEEQFRKMRRVYGSKQINKLIFDEAPYKVYEVKATGTPSLKYVCFNQDVDINDRDYFESRRLYEKSDLYNVRSVVPYGRIYKGEGKLNFIAYYPYAKSRFKYIDEYTFENIPEWGDMEDSTASSVYYNLYDWVDAAGLKLSNSTKSYNGEIYTIDVVTDKGVMYYNPGDVPCGFYLDFITDTEIEAFPGLVIVDTCSGKSLSINGFELYEDNGFRINSKLNLIEGLVLQNGKYVTSGNVYNHYIESGDFFKLPVTEDLEMMTISPMSSSESLNLTGTINYEYLYL